MKDIVNIIDLYLFESKEKKIPEVINERLRVFSEDNIEKPIETYKWEFTKKAVNKIAKNYDAKIEVFDKDLKTAKLRDSKGRLIFIDGS